jgi:hypothetical protein
MITSMPSVAYTRVNDLFHDCTTLSVSLTPQWDFPDFDHHAIYMGPWDIMSQHLVRRGEPPPGISSFTKIRLGWIKSHQVQIVKPGETSFSFLAPLSKGGEPLVIKIPLNDGTYYLVENRQPIGFDRVLPDSGILVLKVNLEAAEGYGTVEVKSAGGVRNFHEATYKLEANTRNVFVDRGNNVSIIPLWKQSENLGVLITTPDLSERAVKAAQAIQALIDQNLRAPDNEKQILIHEAIAAFRSKDFEKSYVIATRLHQR